jgi:hypothetical protein
MKQTSMSKLIVGSRKFYYFLCSPMCKIAKQVQLGTKTPYLKSKFGILNIRSKIIA